METLALRLVLPPLVVLVASLAQQRLGDRLGGLLVGLPLTSGTFLALLLPHHDRALVVQAGAGMLAGQIAVVVFALTYARLVWRGVLTAIVGSLVCWILTLVSARLSDNILVTALTYCGAVLISLRLWPAMPSEAVAQTHSPRRSALVVRVLLATVLIMALTFGVGLLGPHLAGLLSAAPLVALVIAPSTHRHRGAAAAQLMLSGVARGSVAAAAFAVVVMLCVERLGAASLVMAPVACLATASMTSRVRTGVLR